MENILNIPVKELRRSLRGRENKSSMDWELKKENLKWIKIGSTVLCQIN